MNHMNQKKKKKKTRRKMSYKKLTEVVQSVTSRFFNAFLYDNPFFYEISQVSLQRPSIYSRTEARAQAEARDCSFERSLLHKSTARPKGEAHRTNGTFVRVHSFEKAVAFSKKNQQAVTKKLTPYPHDKCKAAERPRGSGEPRSPAGRGAEPHTHTHTHTHTHKKKTDVNSVGRARGGVRARTSAFLGVELRKLPISLFGYRKRIFLLRRCSDRRDL